MSQPHRFVLSRVFRAGNARLLVFLCVTFLFAGCPDLSESTGQVAIERDYFFLAHLHEAEISAEEPRFVREVWLSIDGEHRNAIFAHADSTITFRDVSVREGAHLSFAIGIRGLKRQSTKSDGVDFSIQIRPDGATPKRVFFRTLDPRRNPSDRKWLNIDLDLSSFPEGAADFIFRTVKRANAAHDHSVWANPVLHSNGRLAPLNKTEDTNVILITVDTLRADLRQHSCEDTEY